MSEAVRTSRVVILSQPFYPDPAAVGQYLTDVAVDLVKRGYQVTVYTSGRGYDDPSKRYATNENYRGVAIKRLRLTSFGKKKMLLRGFGVASFIIQSALRCAFLKKGDIVLFSTTPPFIGTAAVIGKKLHRNRIVYWAMDLNPDQLIKLGKLRETSLVARVMEIANFGILKNSDLILTLDKYMERSIVSRGNFADKVIAAPLWALEAQKDAESASLPNPFSVQHRLEGKVVIMYSGNHSVANPLTTLLRAIERFKGDDRVRFLFVGGGVGKREVEDHISAHDLRNALSLPYEPIANLGNLLLAADVHVVSMGNEMVGVVHPCKVYGAMAAGKPILYLGPKRSHIGDILDKAPCGWHVDHGDVDECERVIREILALDPASRGMKGALAKRYLGETLAPEDLLRRVCDGIVDLGRGRSGAAAWENSKTVS